MLFWGEETHIDITRSGFELVKRVQALLLFSMTLGLSGKAQGYQTEKTEEKFQMWVSEFQSGQSELGGEDRDPQLESEEGGTSGPHTLPSPLAPCMRHQPQSWPFLLLVLDCLTVRKAEKEKMKTSLVIQWIRICLPMQETRVRSLIWEYPTYLGAISPCSTATEPRLLKPVLCNKRSHHNEKPTQHN